jgi:hypothetical protein
MLAMRLVRLIETHADQLSHGITQRLEHDPRCADLRKVPLQELQARSYEVYRHLSDWLLYKTERELERVYTEIGARRARQGVAFSHVLYAMAATKELLWTFLQNEVSVTKPAELFGEMELYRMLDQFYDKAIFYIAEGYEHARVREEVVAS